MPGWSRERWALPAGTVKEALGSSDPGKEPGSIFRFCLFGLDGFLDLHVVKFFGVKDFATLQTLDKLGVIVPGDYTHSRVFANRCHRFLSRLDSGVSAMVAS